MPSGVQRAVASVAIAVIELAQHPEHNRGYGSIPSLWSTNQDAWR